MRRIVGLLLTGLVALTPLAGCGAKDQAQCDFYRALADDYQRDFGYVPYDVRDSIDEWC